MSNAIIEVLTESFTDGLEQAVEAGTDTFSFEFDPKEWPEDKPLMIQVAGNVAPGEPMAVLVLIRPKSAVDEMTAVMQHERENMLRQLEAQGHKVVRPQAAIPSGSMEGK